MCVFYMVQWGYMCEGTLERNKMTKRPSDHLTAILAEVLQHPKEKPFIDLRDRAAHMYVTGSFPSHLRPYFTALLGFISEGSEGPPSFGRGLGPRRIKPEVASRLNLDDHPMVVKTRSCIKEGYRIALSLGSTDRRPYTKVFMTRRAERDDEEIIVQIDGSVLDHW